MINNYSGARERKARSARDVINKAIKKLGRDGFLEKLVEMAQEESATTKTSGTKDLDLLKKEVNRIVAVALTEAEMKVILDHAGCELSEAQDLLTDRGIVLLKDDPEPLKDLMLDDFRWKRIQEDLKDVRGSGESPRTLYEFLGKDRRSSNDDLHEVADKKYDHYFRRRNNSGKNLASTCQVYFPEDQVEKTPDRRKYDLRLVHEELRTSLERAGSDGRITVREIEGLFGTARQERLSRDLVIQYIWSWARRKKIEVANLEWPDTSVWPADVSKGSGQSASGGATRGTGPKTATGKTSSPTSAGPTSGGATRVSGTDTSRLARRLVAATAVAALGVVALWPDTGSQPSGVSRPAGSSGQAVTTRAQQLSLAREEEEAMSLGQGTWRSVQAGLSQEGFSPGGTDGIPGTATRDALGRWQRSRGLPDSGYLDALQLAALETVGAAELARVEAVRVAGTRAREDSVARAREAARVAAARAREDSVAQAQAQEAARVAAARAREDSVAQVREAARVAGVARARQAAAARAREDSIARAREATRARAARIDESRISSDFRELESEVESRYSEMTRRYLGYWRMVDWDDERPRVVFRGNSSVDYQTSNSAQTAYSRLIRAGNQLRSELLKNAVSTSQSVQRQMTPRIEAAHQEYQQTLGQHQNRFQALIGNAPGKVMALLIDVNPSDTRVYINGFPYGTAREFANEPGRLIPSGTFRVRLEREGYRTHEETVRARAYQRHFIRGDMPRNQQ